MKLAFHSFEDHLAVSDEYDSVRCVDRRHLQQITRGLLSDLFSCSVWDWRSRRRLSRFANGTGSGPITSLYFINEVSEALLLTASCATNSALKQSSWR